MLLTIILLSIVIGFVFGVIGGIFFPESEEEKRKRKAKGSWWKPSNIGGRYFY